MINNLNSELVQSQDKGITALKPHKSVLIVGIENQIGINLQKILFSNNINAIGTSRNNQNINENIIYFNLDELNFDIFNTKFDYVIICSSLSDNDNYECERLNEENMIKLIDYFIIKDSFVVFLSSIEVFDGTKPFYKITDETNPKTTYGKKLSTIENHIQNKSCILRITKLVTNESSFIKRWENEANNNTHISAFSNRFLSPINIENVVDSIMLLINRKQFGVFHLGGSKEVSYYEFAKNYFSNCEKKLALLKETIDTTNNNFFHYNSLVTYLPTKEVQYEELLTTKRVMMGLMSGYVYMNDPKRLTFTLARYKFVSKMFSGFDNVLEIGCADAFGTSIIVKEVKKLVACDFDPVFIDDARRTHPLNKDIEFKVHDMFKNPMDVEFEGIFSLDVLEHISKSDEDQFMRNICASLSKNGVCIIGMPSLESQLFASPASKEGHVNCKNGDEFKKFLLNYFDRVFLFSMNDEVVHTGFYPMAHYLIALCCSPIK